MPMAGKSIGAFLPYRQPRKIPLCSPWSSLSGPRPMTAYSVEGFTNAVIKQGSNATATIRFAQSQYPETAYAYLPARHAAAGDIWFGTAYAGSADDLRKPVAGNYAWHTLLHELGHSLGLKHGHEADVYGASPKQYDSIEYSIMTYRGHIGADIEGNYYYEQFGAADFHDERHRRTPAYVRRRFHNQ